MSTSAARGDLVGFTKWRRRLRRRGHGRVPHVARRPSTPQHATPARSAFPGHVAPAGRRAAASPTVTHESDLNVPEAKDITSRCWCRDAGRAGRLLSRMSSVVDVLQKWLEGLAGCSLRSTTSSRFRHRRGSGFVHGRQITRPQRRARASCARPWPGRAVPPLETDLMEAKLVAIARAGEQRSVLRTRSMDDRVKAAVRRAARPGGAARAPAWKRLVRLTGASRTIINNCSRR